MHLQAVALGRKPSRKEVKMNKERIGLWITAVFAAMQSLYEIFSKLF